MDEKLRGLVQLGTTWWGKSWIKNMLKHGRFFRMQRAITYTLENRVSNVVIKKGEIFALCQGTAPTPYRVRIEFTPIVSAQWRKVIEEMGESILFESKLLSGEMPQHINKLFLRNGVPLFPVPKQNLDATCNCPDEAIPCKHISAVILTLASIFDYDPFMLFLLRGKSREELLTELCGLSMRKHGSHRASKIKTFENDDQEDAYDYFLTPDITYLRPIEFDVSKLEMKESLIHQLGTPPEVLNPQFSTIISKIYQNASKHANELIFHTKPRKKKGKKE